MMSKVPSHTGIQFPSWKPEHRSEGCHIGNRSTVLSSLGARTLTLLFCGFELTVASVNSWIQDPIVCSQSPAASLFPSKGLFRSLPPPSSQDRGGHQGECIFSFPWGLVCLPLTPLSRNSCLENFCFPKMLTRNNLAERA